MSLRMLVSCGMSFTIQLVKYRNPKDIEMYLEQLLLLSGFVLCPGIKEYPTIHDKKPLPMGYAV